MWETLLEWCEYIFPERADHRIVRTLQIDDIFSRPRVLDGVVSLLSFQDPIVRALIHEAKFYGNERAFFLLSAVLAKYLNDAEASGVLVPMPLSEKRKRERRYNQVEEVVRRVPGMTMEIGALFRSRDTKAQTSLKRKDRLTNVIGAFEVRDPELLQGRDVILIDDVITTGATLKAAAAALEACQPSSITLLALAH